MEKDDLTWLNIFYTSLAFVSAYIIWLLIQQISLEINLEERLGDYFGFSSVTLATLLGLGVVFFVRGKQERNEFLLNSIAELRKVSWPSGPDTKTMTIIVCIVVGIFSVILGVFDIVWAKLLNWLLS